MCLSNLPNRTLSSIVSGLELEVIDLLPVMRNAAAQWPPFYHVRFPKAICPLKGIDSSPKS